MAQPPIHLCFIGDSFTLGLGDPQGLGWAGRLAQSVRKQHPDLIVYNLGIAAEPSTQLAQRCQTELIPRLEHSEKGYVVICTGLYDTVTPAGQSPLSSQVTLEQMTQILKTAHACGCKLLVIGPPSVYATQLNQRIKRTASLVFELCKRAKIPCIPLFTLTHDDTEYRRELGQHDQCLPRQYGYQKLFEHISNDRQWWFA